MDEEMGSQELHVVVGGTGAIGGAVVEGLARADIACGASVDGKGPCRPGSSSGSRSDGSQQAIDAVAGASVVYQCAAPEYTRWVQEFPALQANVADAAERAGARLVVIENLYMYGPTDGPMLETTPMAATGKKGSLRARLSRDLLERHQAGRLRVAIGRASDYYGPGAMNSAVGEQFFAAVARGKGPRWMGRLDQPHALSYLPDIAAGLVTLGEHPEADGQAGISRSARR